MKLGGVVIPTIATVAVVAVGAVAVALVANGVLASEPAAEPSPTPVPSAEETTQPDPAPEPATTIPFLLELPKFPEKSEQAAPTLVRSTGATRSEPPAQSQGKTYSWEDGDRTLNVVLQEDLVVEKSSEIVTEDVVVVKGVADSIVQKQARHDTDAGPVFKSESGGELMTLPGGVLLALDPDWDESQVDDFFTQNNISNDRVSELDFIENGFVIETGSGFPSLNLANELAREGGVLISSPNWSRQVETK